MSMNIPPHIPQIVVNSAAPATESLAKANAIKEVVPPAVKAQAIVPQKSREQDVRPPINQPSSSTYDDIQTKQKDAEIIPDDESQGRDEQTPEQESNSEKNSSDNNGAAQAEDSSKENEAPDVNANNTKDESQAQKRESNEQAQQQQKQVQQLQQRDNEVKAHEQAHAAIGGTHAGTPNYEYQTGPNGQKYAVGGEVSIDVSKEATPEATIRKMQTVQAAALAPAEPSGQDRKVAAQASRNIAEAKAEIIQQNTKINTANGDSRTENTSDGRDENIDLDVSSQDVGNKTSNDIEQPNTMSLAKEAEYGSKSEQFETKVAQVISSRYSNSHTPHEQGFSAVA